MANIWNKGKTFRAGRALVDAALAAGGRLTYSQGWEKVKVRKNEGVVSGILGSYATYDKVIKGLLDRGTFIHEDDPEDGRITILRLRDVDQAITEQAFLNTFDKIKALTERPAFPIPQQEWMQHVARVMEGKHASNAEKYESVWKHPYLTQKEKVEELVKLSHALFIKMEAQHNKARLEGAFISTHNNGILIVSRGMYDSLLDDARILQRIRKEGKKDPRKEMWLKELGVIPS